MATYEELIRAAGKADAAGNTEAVREILAAAQQMRRPQFSQDGLAIPQADAEPNPRQIEDRFGDTIKKATDGPIAATKYYAAQSQDRSRSRLERAGDYAMTGLNALGVGAAGAAGLVGETLGGSPTNEKKLARDLLMAGSVAVPELAGVSSAAGLAAGSARAASRAIPPPKNAIEAGKRAAGDLGITPSLGAGGKVRSMTAATLEKAPVAGDAIAKDATRFVGEIEAAATRIKAKVGTASNPNSAGTALQEGLGQYVERSKAKAVEKFDRVGELIPAESPVPLNNTAQALEDAKAAFQGNPELAKTLGLNKWDGIVGEAQENGINWQAVRQFRTSVGEAIGGRGNDVLQGEAKSRLDVLYGALTEDMEAAANAAGPQASAAWNQANTFYKQFAQRVETALDRTINADNPERAFEAFDRMTKADSSSADVNRMLKIKASLKPSEWSDLSASIVERLGKPTAGQQDAAGGGFSPARFLTQWNGMSQEAKRILLPGPVRDELQKLADVAGMAKQAGAERNFSNTGNVVAGAATGTAAMQAPITTLFAVGGVWGSTRAMTSPIFLRALNRAGRGDLKQIKAMAEGRGPFVQDARTVLQVLGAETGSTANQNTQPLRAVQ